MTTPLSLWTIKTIHGPHDYSVFQIERNGEPYGEPWVFKGHAVREKMRLIRAESDAARDKIRAEYASERHA